MPGEPVPRVNRLLLLLLAAALAALPAASHLQRPGDPAEIERVEQMIDQALAALREWNRAGGKDGAPDHPAHEWAARLWEYREKHPGTEAASLATAEALHQWVHAGQLDRVYAEARKLPSGDPAWERVLDVLGEASVASGDTTPLVEIAEALAARAPAGALAEKVRMTLARLYRNAGDTERASAHYRAVVEMNLPDSRALEQARTALYQIDHLSPGKPAPEFAAKPAKGPELSLAALRGRPVLIIFWASW